jgi:hypothetical protein
MLICRGFLNLEHALLMVGSHSLALVAFSSTGFWSIGTTLKCCPVIFDPFAKLLSFPVFELLLFVGIPK